MARPHGTKNIETPEKMLEYFEQYAKEVKSNPFIVKDWVGGLGKEVNRLKEKPLTIEGFEIWCFDNGIINDLGDYFSNKDNNYADYSTICLNIKKRVRIDQIAGGMAGVFNPSITQRLNGLVEKQQTEITATVKQLPWVDDTPPKE